MILLNSKFVYGISLIIDVTFWIQRLRFRDRMNKKSIFNIVSKITLALYIKKVVYFSLTHTHTQNATWGIRWFNSSMEIRPLLFFCFTILLLITILEIPPSSQITKKALTVMFACVIWRGRKKKVGKSMIAWCSFLQSPTDFWLDLISQTVVKGYILQARLRNTISHVAYWIPK